MERLDTAVQWIVDPDPVIPYRVQDNEKVTEIGHLNVTKHPGGVQT